MSGEDLVMPCLLVGLSFLLNVNTPGRKEAGGGVVTLVHLTLIPNQSQTPSRYLVTK